MIFNSLVFVVFLLLVFGLYWGFAARGGLRRRNLFLIAAGYIFYGWWDWRFLILIFSTSAGDFIFAREIERTESRKRKKGFLAGSLVMNLGLLGFFKYYDFFAAGLQRMADSVGVELDSITLGLVVPVGLSFYTFQEMAYTIDVYRGNAKACREPITFLAYVAFFPQLVAGPIERARTLMPQFSTVRPFDYGAAVEGLRLMLWGFFKKMVIADVLAEYVKLIFDHPQEFHGMDIILGAMFFTIQVYCDFSGYSDIAIGTARLFNFQLTQNFRTPFFSSSLRELFSRWHITLMSWFRDYLYFPLGGSRVPYARYLFNLFIVFLVSGIWHGAENRMVIWGAFLGLCIVAETVTGLDKKPGNPLLRGLGMLRTFVLFSFALIFFRSLSSGYAFAAIGNIFTGEFGEMKVIHGYSSELNLFLGDGMELLYILFLFFTLFVIDFMIGPEDFNLWIGKYPRALRWSFYYLLALWFLLLGGWTHPEIFVYFQF